MSYLKWAALIVPSIVMAIVGRIFAPILPFFVQDDGYLPRWLWWFQTPDNPCDGDSGHWKRWPSTTALGTYCRRVAWFLRNVCYGFDIDMLGVEVLTTDLLLVEGNENAGDQTGISGTCKRWLYRDDKLIAWQVYVVKHYRALGFHACVRVNLGWKLWGAKEGVKQFTAYFHPAKGFEREA